MSNLLYPAPKNENPYLQQLIRYSKDRFSSMSNLKDLVEILPELETDELILCFAEECAKRTGAQVFCDRNRENVIQSIVLRLRDEQWSLYPITKH